MEQESKDEAKSPKVPEGKVMLGNGDICKRTQIAFPLDFNQDDPDMLRASSGTVYRRDENGTLRRLFKPSKTERKALKKALRKDLKAGNESVDPGHQLEESVRVSGCSESGVEGAVQNHV